MFIIADTQIYEIEKNTALVFNDLYGGNCCKPPSNIVAGRYCFYSCFLCPQGHCPAIGWTINGRPFTPSLGYSQLECWNTYLFNTKKTQYIRFQMLHQFICYELQQESFLHRFPSYQYKVTEVLLTTDNYLSNKQSPMLSPMSH